MTLLSLDIAFSNLGFTVWQKGKPIDAGVIKTEKTKVKGKLVSDDNSERCKIIVHALNDLFALHGIKGVIGEMPSGSQSSNAAKAQGLITGVVVAVCETNGIPVEWCTQQAVKKAICGQLSASKRETNLAVAKRLDIKVTSETIGKRKHPEFKFYFLSMIIPEGEWEHIADSIGTYWALKGGNLVKLFG